MLREYRTVQDLLRHNAQQIRLQTRHDRFVRLHRQLSAVRDNLLYHDSLRAFVAPRFPLTERYVLRTIEKCFCLRDRIREQLANPARDPLEATYIAYTVQAEKALRAYRCLEYLYTRRASR